MSGYQGEYQITFTRIFVQHPRIFTFTLGIMRLNVIVYKNIIFNSSNYFPSTFQFPFFSRKYRNEKWKQNLNVFWKAVKPRRMDAVHFRIQFCAVFLVNLFAIFVTNIFLIFFHCNSYKLKAQLKIESRKNWFLIRFLIHETLAVWIQMFIHLFKTFLASTFKSGQYFF